MFDLTVLVPDHCLSFYFFIDVAPHSLPACVIWHNVFKVLRVGLIIMIRKSWIDVSIILKLLQ